MTAPVLTEPDIALPARPSLAARLLRGVLPYVLALVLAFPAATVLVAAAAGILSTGALPRPVAYAGLVAAALQVLAAVSLEEVALAAFAVWVGLTSAAMHRSRGG